VFRIRWHAAGGEFQVNTQFADNQIAPSVAMDADGDFVVVWQSQSDGHGDGIYARRYSAEGVPQSGPFLVNATTNGNQRDPSVANCADGDFVVAWTSLDQDGSSYGIYTRRFSASGVPQSGDFQVNTFTLGLQAAPSVDGWQPIISE
jgi:hypothetical protein